MLLLAVAMVRRELCQIKDNLAILVNCSEQCDLSRIRTNPEQWRGGFDGDV